MARLHTGYTLVELSIVTIIVGLLTAGGLAVGASMVERAAYIDTRKLIDQLHQTLKDHYIVTGRLPCAARMDLAPGNVNFGAEVNCAAAVAGTWRDGGVRIGAIPTRALGLPDSAAGDKFGNRFVYAVAEGLTSAATFGSTPGAITVRDMNNNTILTDAAFFIASPGRDRKGAYIHNTGATGDACSPAANLDTLNCTLTSAVFRDAPFNNGDVAARFFDDVTAWAPKFHLSGLSTISETLWAANGDANLYSVGTDDDTSNTNVGIGTTSPQERLDVSGNMQTTTGFLGTGGHGATYMHLSHRNHKGVGQYALLQDGANGHTFLNSTASGNLYLRHNNADRMFIRGADGFAGIGTVNPAYRLHVLGDLYANDGWVRTGGATGWYNQTFGGGWYMQDSTWIRSYGGKPVYMQNGFDTGGASGVGCGGGLGGGYMFNVCGSANIGNWPDTPTVSIVLSGSTHIRGNTHLNGSIWAYQGIATYAWLVASDQRLKKNIRDLPVSGLEVVGQLRPVVFDWKEHKGNADKKSENYGFIAQEVEQVLPHLVTETEMLETGEKTKVLNEQAIIPFLAKAIQELEADNKALRLEEMRIKSRIEALEGLRKCSSH